MAYTVIKTEQGANAGNGYYTEYLCESVDDIATLPTEVENGGPRPGSLALLEDGTVYILKNNREWSEFSMAGGGGGSGSGGGALFVEFTYDPSNHYTSVLPASDVVTAFFAGTPVMCHFPSEEGGAPNDIVKTVTWILRPPEDAGGTIEIGFDASEQYITYSGIEDGYIVCSVYIPD